MSPFISLAFDILLLAAFGVTIFYCIRLSRQFSQMQADRKAFESLIQSLNTASSRAEAAIHAFRDIASNSGSSLQDKIGKARALADELEIMLRSGDNLANRLQAVAEKSRKAAIPEPNNDILTDDDDNLKDARRAEQAP